MSAVPTPPLLPERLLAAVLPDAGWRDSIVGDLREEFVDLARRLGVRSARRWYWKQSLAIGGRAMAHRAGVPRLRSRNWLAPPDAELGAAGGGSWRAGLRSDLRHGWRTLTKRPATSIVIVITLALTLSANSTIFAIVDAMVLRPYRFPGVERLVMPITRGPRDQNISHLETVAPADFREWRAEARTLRHLSAAGWWDANLSGIDTPQQVAGFRVTADFFDALGVVPLLGRDFVPQEEMPGAHTRAVIGHGLWTRVFGADPQIVGKTVRLDGEPYEVVGVAPEGFAIPLGAEVWAPLALSADAWNNRRGRFLTVVGQFADGATIDQVRTEFEAIVARQQRDNPESNQSRTVRILDFTTGMADPGSGPFLGTVQAAGVLLLLVACANIANLLLARGSERSHEFAVRLALGASRGRLAWQTILGASLLTLLALVVTVPLAWAGTELARMSIPAAVIRFIPGWAYIRVSYEQLAVLAIAAAVVTVLFSLVPALQAARSGVSDALRQAGRSLTPSRPRLWMRSALATAQVALTLALLFGSALALSAADRAVDGSFGFDKRHLLVGSVVLPERPYAEPERRRQFVDSVLDRMRAIPAVTGAGVVSNLPYAGNNTAREFWPEGVTLRQQDVGRVDFRRATADYFATMRIPLLDGRNFSSGDRPDTPAVALVSRSLADRYWPGQSAIGRRFRHTADGAWITVVGVVGDVLHDWFQQRRAPTVYRPISQDVPLNHVFVARTVGDPLSVAGDLRRAITSADPDQPVLVLNSMERFIEDRTSGITFIAYALAEVGVIAFALAIMGLYSLIAFITSRRTQEIGVHMALGAGRWQVLRLTMRQALWITAAGLLIGAVFSAGLGRLMETVMLGVVSTNFWQLGGLMAVLAMVALVAAYVPARRATSIDPTIALRAE